MQGRVKQKHIQQQEQAIRRKAADPPVCAFCLRPLGTHVELHHFIPKSEGGNQTVPVHPICHRAIHAHVSNHDLAATDADLSTLRQREELQRFLKWIANKPANFHAPTRRSRKK